MGAITLEELPAFLDRWHVLYDLEPGWETRGRASGGFDAIRGIVVHHTASNTRTPLVNTIHYALVGPDHPIANGGLSRSADGPRFVLWAGLAANHAGKGGPRLTSRGVIAQDAANRVTVGIEAENNGVGEPWSPDALDLYVRLVAAVLDWANSCTPGAPLGPGDVFAHREWTPGRKIDPAGPSRFADGSNVWDMDRFRGEVFLLMLAGPDPTAVPYPLPPAPEPDPVEPVPVPVPVPEPEPTPAPCTQPPTCSPGEVSQRVVELQTLLAADTWYPYNVDGSYGPRTMAGVRRLQSHLANAGNDPGPVDGIYGERTRAALCDYMAAG